MTDIDTSPEAVERLAQRLERAPLYEGHGEESETPELSAATLRAIYARLIAAEGHMRVTYARLTEADAEIGSLAKACGEWVVTSQRNYQRAKAAEAERDRLRAALRVNALRLDPGLSHAQITAEIDGIATRATPC